MRSCGAAVFARTTVLAAMACLLAVCAPAQEAAWRAGTTLGQPETVTTDTLTLLLAEAPGLYRIPEARAEVQLAILPTSAERPMPLRVVSSDGKSHVLESVGAKKVRIEMARSSDETFVARVSAPQATRALITASVRPLADSTTTATLTSPALRPLVLAESEDSIRVVQMLGGEPLKLKRDGGHVMIGTISDGLPLYVTIGKTERTLKELDPQLVEELRKRAAQPPARPQRRADRTIRTGGS